jgi:hypothetical protein
MRSPLILDCGDVLITLVSETVIEENDWSNKVIKLRFNKNN